MSFSSSLAMFIPHHQMLIISQGHPLLPRINDILLRLIESGLVDFWANRNEHKQSEYAYLQVNFN